MLCRKIASSVTGMNNIQQNFQYIPRSLLIMKLKSFIMFFRPGERSTFLGTVTMERILDNDNYNYNNNNSYYYYYNYYFYG